MLFLFVNMALSCDYGCLLFPGAWEWFLLPQPSSVFSPAGTRVRKDPASLSELLYCLLWPHPVGPDQIRG
jgi:hypothetical protein